MPFSQATVEDPFYRHIAQNDIQGYLSIHPATSNLLFNQIDTEMFQIIVSCLQMEPINRPTISDLISSKFVAFVADEPTEAIT